MVDTDATRAADNTGGTRSSYSMAVRLVSRLNPSNEMDSWFALRPPAAMGQQLTTQAPV